MFGRTFELPLDPVGVGHLAGEGLKRRHLLLGLVELLLEVVVAGAQRIGFLPQGVVVGHLPRPCAHSWKRSRIPRNSRKPPAAGRRTGPCEGCGLGEGDRAASARGRLRSRAASLMYNPCATAPGPPLSGTLAPSAGVGSRRGCKLNGSVTVPAFAPTVNGVDAFLLFSMR